MTQDGTVSENDKYTIGAPGFDAAAFDRRHLEQNMSKLERIGRKDCGAFALELYLPRDFSYKEARRDNDQESKFYFFWVVRVTERIKGEKLSVILPTSYNKIKGLDQFSWYAERKNNDGRWVEIEKTLPHDYPKSEDRDVGHKFSGNELTDYIVLQTHISSALSPLLHRPEDFTPGRYRIHMGQFSAQIEGQKPCYFDTTIWDVNIRR